VFAGYFFNNKPGKPMATNQKGARRGSSRGGSSEPHRQAGQQSHRDGDRRNTQGQQAPQRQYGTQGGCGWSPEAAREQGKKGGPAQSKSS